MNKKLKLSLKHNFIPPKPLQKEQFINSISYPKAKFSKVLIAQIGFIRKRVWLLFAMCVCFAVFYTGFAEIPQDIVSGVSAVLPLFSLCVVTEIHKSCAHNMDEMELACRHNLPKITLMRLGILGTLSFVMLFFLVAIVGENDFGTLRNTVYIAVPYLFSSYVSLLIISKLHTKETVYVCTAASTVISILTLLVGNNFERLYSVNLTFIWVVTFLMLAILLILGFAKLVKSQEELQWNLS